MIDMLDDYMAQQGWQCPICKRVYSPFTMMCYYCGGEQNVTTTTGTETISPYRDTLTIKLGEPVKCKSSWEGTDQKRCI